ncbi:unnamed protein product [Durusdinium trenchii]|uniref:Glutathione S-transferase omega-like 2 n=2 Tax=Durusdinium trenchii TaxID=1381693 RepID=A0ABP0PUP2_9DINO
MLLWSLLLAKLGFVCSSAPHFGIPWQQRQTHPDGWQEALLHPSSLHVARSALRLGGVPWQRVRQQALKAERAELAAEAVFWHLGGKQSSPDRLLIDECSLCAAYGALLTNQMLRLHWREEECPASWREDGDRRSDAVCGMEIYCSRRHEAAQCIEGPSGVLCLARRPQALASRRWLALADPRLLSPWRRKLKPRWGKVWDYAKKMMEGEDFPPVSIAWREELEEWTWRDGCHRYFASLVSGRFLPVSFKEPRLRIR